MSEKRKITIRDIQTQEIVETMEFPTHETLYNKAFSGLCQKIDFDRFYIREDWRQPESSRNETLDRLVVLTLKNGKSRLQEITKAIVDSEHKHGVTISGTALPASRHVDRSLQRLRKAGKVGYTASTGWGAYE